ncbi:hypothetical protein MFIFM68171_00486 [Madurella fahalii]|uniref:Transmembrane protein n=1 Tax=Madurella fahalii TaxID=1157608 RepID=A0ABQ0FXR3_9PEZI
MAPHILVGVEGNSFAVCSDWGSALVFSGIMGLSSGQGLVVIDMFLKVLLLVLVWSLVNSFWFERMCKRHPKLLEWRRLTEYPLIYSGDPSWAAILVSR